MSVAVVEELEVGDLDATGLLAAALANEQEIRQRERLRLQFAYQWAVLHPVTDESGVETPGGPAFSILEKPDSLGGEAPLPWLPSPPRPSPPHWG